MFSKVQYDMCLHTRPIFKFSARKPLHMLGFMQQSIAYGLMVLVASLHVLAHKAKKRLAVLVLHV